MKKTNNKPTAAELRAWAKAANILGEKEDGVWPVQIEGLNELLWIAGPAALRQNMLHIDDLWRPDLYVPHVAPVVEALGINMIKAEGLWGSPVCVLIRDDGPALPCNHLSKDYATAACAAIREKLKEGEK